MSEYTPLSRSQIVILVNDTIDKVLKEEMMKKKNDEEKKKYELTKRLEYIADNWLQMKQNEKLRKLVQSQ